MTRMRCVLALVFLFWSTSAHAQDAIDLTQAVMHTPAPASVLPVGVVIKHVSMRPGRDDGGLSFRFEPPRRWPEFVPPTPLPDGPWTGGLQYTVHACAMVDGRVHCGGFIQMWTSRVWTGAPILSQWKDWAYGDRWGELASYQPRAGDKMWFFLVAGNARTGQPYETALRERSNVVEITLPAGDTGEFDFADVPVNPPVVPPVVPPTTTPEVPSTVLTDIAQLKESVSGLQLSFLDVKENLNALFANLHEIAQSVEAINGRVTALEGRKIPTSCKASISGIIPISCRLE